MHRGNIGGNLSANLPIPTIERTIMKLLFATARAATVAATATALILTFAAGAAVAEPSEKEAIALVDKGAAFLKSKGKDELIKRILAKDPDFVNASLYLFMCDLKTGVLVAHPMNPALIGKDLTDVPDVTGKKFRREIIDLAAKDGKGWVDYSYKNPTTGKIEPKTTYVMRVEDVVLEAGIYKK
jgi:cytochrome c